MRVFLLTPRQRDGLEAVNAMNANPTGFDLILMDIIMPMLDGVSATSCIRDVNPTIPIIAMTSNIRQDDIEIYFRYGKMLTSQLERLMLRFAGMNGLLPKPFTKDGLLKVLERHLAPFKKDYQASPQQSHHSDSYAQLSINVQQNSATQSFKDEPSPGKSSASSWHSPNQINSSSPVGTGSQNTYMQMQPGQQMQQGSGQYAMAPAHQHVGYQSQSPTAIGTQRAGGPGVSQGQGQARSGGPGPQRRGIGDMGSNMEEPKPEKRQRMYPPRGGFS
jgi:osomolarity two-component system, response regulator SKN7